MDCATPRMRSFLLKYSKLAFLINILSFFSFPGTKKYCQCRPQKLFCLKGLRISIRVEELLLRCGIICTTVSMLFCKQCFLKVLSIVFRTCHPRIIGGTFLQRDIARLELLRSYISEAGTSEFYRKKEDVLTCLATKKVA